MRLSAGRGITPPSNPSETQWALRTAAHFGLNRHCATVLASKGKGFCGLVQERKLLLTK